MSNMEKRITDRGAARRLRADDPCAAGRLYRPDAGAC